LESNSRKTNQEENMMEKKVEGIYWVFSEAALYFFLLYSQHLLGVTGNGWLSSFILTILLNIVFLLRPCTKKAGK
jgi:hypothetical protein